MLQVKELTKKVWVHTAMEKELRSQVNELAKKLAKPKCEVLSALVARGLRASKTTARKRTKTKR